MAVLLLVGLGEMGAVGWAFVARYRALTQQSRMAPKAPPAGAMAANEEALALESLDPLPPGEGPEETPAAVLAEPAPIVPPERPEPVAVARLALKAPPSTRYQELVEQGRVLRERGDMSNALTKLREAQALEPGTAQALTELALTFEKMGLLDKSAEQWRRVYEMGEGAGSYYTAAAARLKQTQSAAIQGVQAAAGEIPANPGWTLCLGEISSEPMADPAAARKFLLKVPLKLRPEGHVDVRDVAIHVLFYELVDGKNLVQTSANVSSRWASPPPDWADADHEVLEVEYTQPRADPAQTVREDRKYFGYIVRLYYKKQLEDTRAEPQRLATQFAAPRSL